MPPADLRALAALAALLLLPGVLAVRASWTAVPFLSAAFWILSCVWLPDPSAGRTRFIVFVVALAALLITLRWVRERPRPPVSAAVLAVAAAALLRLAPLAWWDVAPGAEMGLHSLETRLFVWRDGLPRTYEPVLPIHDFGAHPPGLHALAGHVALLSGADPVRATLLVALAAHGLLTLALFALLRPSVEAAIAAPASILAASLVPIPQGFVASGENGAVWGMALAIAAAAIQRTHRSAVSAVAAGLVAGAAALCDPPMVALALLSGGGAGGARRWAWMAGTAALTAAPFLVRHRAWTIEPWTWLGLVVVLGVATVLAFALPRVPAGVRPAVVGVLATLALAVSLRTYFFARVVLVADAADLAAMRWIAESTRVTDVVCADAGSAAARWIPALTGRGTDNPEVPAAYREEGRRRASSRPCTHRYERAGSVVRIFGADGRVAYDRQR